MDSSAATVKKPRAFIFDLPTELLQQVASNCSDETLVTLRLTCKKIEAATLDMWAKEYISRLECFMLDQARLQRVKNIISSRLSNHVRGVVFTLSAQDSFTISPQYRHRTWTMVPSEDVSHLDAGSSRDEDYEDEQYDLHACEVEGFSPAIDSLLSDIARVAAGLEHCSMGIDTQCEAVSYGKISRCRPQLIKSMIDMMLHEGCVVDHVSFCDWFPLKAAHFEHGGALETVSSGLRVLSYWMTPTDEDDLQSTWSQQHWRIIANVIARAKRLSYFEVINTSSADDVDEGNVMPALLARVFANVTTLASLRVFRLFGVNMDSCILSRALESCAMTLDTVALEVLGLRGEGDVWGKVVVLLHAMPKLRSLTMYRMYRIPPGLLTSDNQGWDKAQWKTPGQEVEHLSQKMMEEEPIDAREFLAMVIKDGVEYH